MLDRCWVVLFVRERQCISHAENWLLMHVAIGAAAPVFVLVTTMVLVVAGL
jgi:hypothetical protein